MKHQPNNAAQILRLIWDKERKFRVTPLSGDDTRVLHLNFGHKQPVIRTETRWMKIAIHWQEGGRIA